MTGWGGARPGAGRKKKIGTLRDPAPLSEPAKRALNVQRSIAAHRAATKIDMGAAMPVEVMLDNMRWAQARAQAVADEIAEVERETGKTADPALYKLMLGLRGMAQQCAEGVAPYLHPRLAAVANLDPPNEDGHKTPEELLALVLAKIDGTTRGLPRGRAASSEPALQQPG